ncbi:hypothetical protein BJF79_26960 [Actinomadura sp. CNU-125]|uniref:hypothetical protein n=1 Tax=Actinomadura sp. CNU-125 TaxID=1904961 RepID=UPI0009633B4F|nr:hypothetical protein [Actinomadura sp. CNU-125]OLT38419.1 hypothetical protein BJF79_26960 [Actinomadura sp. CNU-125]
MCTPDPPPTAPRARPRYLFYYDEPPVPVGRADAVRAVAVREFVANLACLVAGAGAVPAGLVLLELLSR